MNFALIVAAMIAVVGVAATMTLRNPVHCILSFALGLVGLAGMYLALGAQFVGFTQVLVYVGAVAILAVFALMMTRAGQPQAHVRRPASATLGGLVAGGVTFGLFAYAIVGYHGALEGAAQAPPVSAREVGLALMHQYAIPLEVIGLLLTAALIGAVVVALSENGEQP